MSSARLACLWFTDTHLCAHANTHKHYNSKHTSCHQTPPSLPAYEHAHTNHDFKMFEIEVEDHTDDCKGYRVCRVQFSGHFGINENSGITGLSKMPLQPIAADILQILAAELTTHEHRVEKKVKTGGNGSLCMHTYTHNHTHTEYLELMRIIRLRSCTNSNTSTIFVCLLIYTLRPSKECRTSKSTFSKG